MRNVLVIFEHQKHIESSAYKFIDNLDEVAGVNKHQKLVKTKDTTYKLIGCGFPYHNNIGDKLNGLRFDEVMIHVDVVLTKSVEAYIKSRMFEVKEFIYFE